METKSLSEWNDQELLDRLKKIKNYKIMDAAMIGFTIGIFVYSAVKNGLGFFTFFPLLIAYFIVRNSKNNKMLANEIQKEIDARNLK